jgi:hypothetical protein
VRRYRGRRFADREFAVLVACCCALVFLIVVGVGLWVGSAPSTHDQLCARQTREVKARMTGIVSAGKQGQERLHRKRLISLIHFLAHADPSC